MNREEMIEALLDNDTDFSGSDGRINLQYLRETLQMGFIGYDNMTDEQLVVECQCRGIIEEVQS